MNSGLNFQVPFWGCTVIANIGFMLNKNLIALFWLIFSILILIIDFTNLRGGRWK